VSGFPGCDNMFTVAIVSHVVNNGVVKVATALGGTVEARPGTCSGFLLGICQRTWS
jgi:hypothetical protein